MALLLVILFFALACATGDGIDMFSWGFPLFVGAISGIIGFVYDEKYNNLTYKEF